MNSHIYRRLFKISERESDIEVAKIKTKQEIIHTKNTQKNKNVTIYIKLQSTALPLNYLYILYIYIAASMT